VSTLDVVAEVLREVAPRALRVRQIAELAGSRLPTASQTPQTVVARDLAVDIRDRGDGSRFLRVARGEYVLKHASPIAFYSDELFADRSRYLIAEGELPQGVVDERPVQNLQPADVAGYRQCHFFGEHETWTRALRDGGWPSEWPVWTGVFQSSTTEDFWTEWLRLVWACRPIHLFFGAQDNPACFSDACSQLEAHGYAVRVLNTYDAKSGWRRHQQHVCFMTASRERGQPVAVRSTEAAHGHWYNEQLELPGTKSTKNQREPNDAVTLPQATSFVIRAIESLTRSTKPDWTGPRADEVAPSGMLLGRVPGDRWPHGPPSAHEARCNLFPHRGSCGGLFCDCALSEASP
jgi:HB1, ASXL, restriction endonuclease HTH domain